MSPGKFTAFYRHRPLPVAATRRNLHRHLRPLDIYRSINAVTESFFATLECELLDRTTFATHGQGRGAIFDFIEGFYNRQRCHSTNGYLSPHEHETRFNEYHQAA